MSKLRLKMGPIEVEYEGAEQFLKEELPDLLKAVLVLYRDSGLAAKKSDGDDEVQLDSTGTAEIGTTANIAAILGGKSGTDLALAAACRLTLGKGKGTFTRAELLDEMKSATSYYKASYSGNLSKTLTTLVGSQKFVESAKSTYALQATLLKEYRQRFAKQG